MGLYFQIAIAVATISCWCSFYSVSTILISVGHQVSGLDLSNTPRLLPPAPLCLPYISGPQLGTIFPSPSPPLGDIRKCLETFWGCRHLGPDTRHAANHPAEREQPAAQDASARDAAAPRPEALHQTLGPHLPTSLCAPAGLPQAVPSPWKHISEF